MCFQMPCVFVFKCHVFSNATRHPLRPPRLRRLSLRGCEFLKLLFVVPPLGGIDSVKFRLKPVLRTFCRAQQKSFSKNSQPLREGDVENSRLLLDPRNRSQQRLQLIARTILFRKHPNRIDQLLIELRIGRASDQQLLQAGSIADFEIAPIA